MSSSLKIALVGNPNTGKTSLFNLLTGLQQKVGNYPGVTVDKKVGTCKLTNGTNAQIIDLPGTYSIHPTSIDESIVLKTLQNKEDVNYPDAIIVVADVENIKRNLLLFTQIKDLEIPTLLVLNMSDEMKRKGISIDIDKLSSELQTKTILISARKGNGLNNLKEAIVTYKDWQTSSDFDSISKRIDAPFFKELKEKKPEHSVYKTWLTLSQNKSSKIKKYRQKETILRYLKINEILKKTYSVDVTKATDLRSRLDRVFTHKIFGYLIFFGLLLLIFQSIFEWASIPMDFIDETFANLSSWVKTKLNPGVLTDLLTDGIIAGLGGVIIFIPQIAILFFFIALLEETGYMSRVVFLMDKIMRKFGMSGKSVIPLISGTACAIPAIMATRTIASWKERLITILVTPFTTCSARLPVYAILIAIVIPNKTVLGFLNLQGLTLLALYLLGFGTAIIAAYILHKVLKIKTKTFFVVEMPDYKKPSLKNVFYDVIEKTKAFVFGAGKIILAISIILWFLASHGPEKFNSAEKVVTENIENQNLPKEELQQKIASTKLENSYIGIAGKTIEPIVAPLGYDWKIGIGLISSFAAREVFIGTLATIYSIEGIEDEATIKERMASEINPNTGKKRFDLATGLSLLIFYAFAMQCMATLAIVKRETKSWKWPIIQLIGMGVLAYVAAFATYQIFS